MSSSTNLLWALGPGSLPPRGVTDYTLLSVDPVKVGQVFLAFLEPERPERGQVGPPIHSGFPRQRTGLNLRKDLLGKLGPRLGAFAPKSGGISNIISMWFNPPDLGIVIELKDPKGFQATLSRLIEAANIELKSAGALVPPRTRRPARPGTEFAEFRRLKAPELGFVLTVPPRSCPPRPVCA